MRYWGLGLGKTGNGFAKIDAVLGSVLWETVMVLKWIGIICQKNSETTDTGLKASDSKG